MTAAYTNYKLGAYEGFGRDIGVALAITFIGASGTKATLTTPSAEA
jgi:hypothetical protein